MDEFLDSIFASILNPILKVFETILSFIFSTRLSTLLFAFLFMNLLGFIMMKLDKKYAKESKWRIKESTLFLTALLFGSFGIFAGMRVFHHKTLHKQFTIGIPIIMAIQVILILIALVKGWLV